MGSGITHSASHVLPWESACQHCPLLCWIQRGFVFPTFLGKISPWTGRFYSLLDPSYAKNNIPIIASVSEHQPTTWSSYYFDLQLLVFMFPGESPDLESVTRGFSCWSKSSGACCVLLSLSAWFYFISELNLTFFLLPHSWSLLLLQQPLGCPYLHHHVWCDQHVLLSCHGEGCGHQHCL